MKHNNGVSLEDELIHSIRGYFGYKNIELREKTDRQLRKYLSSEIEKIKKSFLQISNRVSDDGKVTIADTINKLISQLKTLIETLNKPTYNNSSFFNHAAFNSDTLSQLYQYESLLKHHVSILTDEISDLEKIEKISETDEFLNHLFDVIDNLNQLIMEREFLLTSSDGESIL